MTAEKYVTATSNSQDLLLPRLTGSAHLGTNLNHGI